MQPHLVSSFAMCSQTLLPDDSVLGANQSTTIAASVVDHPLLASCRQIQRILQGNFDIKRSEIFTLLLICNVYKYSAPLPTQEPQQERSHIQRSLVSTTAQEPLQTEAESSVSHQNYESVSLADLRSSQASSQLEDRRTYIHFEPVDVRLPSFSMIVQTGIEFQDTDAVIDFANAYESHCYSILHNLQSGRVNIVSEP